MRRKDGHGGERLKSDWEDECKRGPDNMSYLVTYLAISRAANKTVISEESCYGAALIAHQIQAGECAGGKAVVGDPTGCPSHTFAGRPGVKRDFAPP